MDCAKDNIGHDGQATLSAHLLILLSCIVFGLMAPIGKMTMNAGLSGLDMVVFRLGGGAVLFWLASLFVKEKPLTRRDCLLLLPASMFGLVVSQCGFLYGISLTSLINASVETTTQPIFSLLLSAFILGQRITWRKLLGIFVGLGGALCLILSANQPSASYPVNVWGDVLCLAAQLSFAIYLTAFSRLISRYHFVTINKWMFTYAALMVLPFGAGHVVGIEWQTLSTEVLLGIAYIAVFCSFVGYALLVVAQKQLSPTIISTYNYVQPVVAIIVSLLMGLAVFGAMQVAAIMLVFLGVWMVTHSKLRAPRKVVHV